MLFKNPVRTSKRTPHFTITEINWLTLFKFNTFASQKSGPMGSTHERGERLEGHIYGSME
jgi:hypothetical protein